jgi:uncharacterized membrane protein
MSSHFGYIFWGLLLVFLDFSINGFDLLPDVIGYALVGYGTGGHTIQNVAFRTATSLSWLLAVGSVMAFFISDRSASQFFGWLMTGFQCALVWTLMGGVMAVATERNRPDLAERAASRRVAYVVLTVAMILLTLLPGSGLLAPVAIVLLVALLVVFVMILHLIHRVRYELPPLAAPSASI